MSSNKYVKVLIFGTFDLLHPGHIYFINQSKKLGDHLIAIISRDKTVSNLKGKKPFFSETKRKESLQKLSLCDKVILGSNSNKYKLIAEIKPNIISLGYDQYYLTSNLSNFIKNNRLKTKIVRQDSFKPDIYKSNLILRNMKDTIIIETSCKNKSEAKHISEILLQKKLVVCANIGPQIKSVYLWKRKISSDTEIILTLKTVKSNETRITEIIKKEHSYETPVILSIPIKILNKKAKEWYINNLKI